MITRPILKVQMNNFVFLLIPVFFVSCYGPANQEQTTSIVTRTITDPSDESDVSISTANSATSIDKSIRSVFQDRSGAYWFGTNAKGVYRYDSKTLTQFTVTDGLSNNQIQNIQEDESGNIWFGTGGFGVSKFDGRIFTTCAIRENSELINGSESDRDLEPTDLFFYAGGGAFRLVRSSLVYLPLDKTVLNASRSQSSPYDLSPYAVYSILKDRKGNVWFGTQAKGVCRYDGKSFTWFTEKGLAGSAVLALFEDMDGNIWFGNNGAGLFRNDGKSVTNFTDENNLSNNDFKVSGKSGPGTLARVYSINEDNCGNLWIGTVDAGVWKYDGNNLINYTTQDGLTGIGVNTIYKDRNGELWFGTDDNGVCKFDGIRFREFIVQ